MQSWRDRIGLLGALVPIVWFAWLIWYFIDMGGLSDPFLSEELRPTIFGLAILELILVVVLGWRVRRVVFRMPPDDESGRPNRHTPRGPDESGSSAETDAMIARYLAQRNEPAPAAVAPDAAPKGARPSVSFGRRTGYSPN